MLISESGPRPAGETSCQVAPPSFVSCRMPLLVPAQITLAATGEGENALMALRFMGAMVSCCSCARGLAGGVTPSFGGSGSAGCARREGRRVP